jgi:hypothetical protein
MHLNQSLRRTGYEIPVHDIISAENLSAMAEKMVDAKNQYSKPALMLTDSKFALLPSTVDLEKLLRLLTASAISSQILLLIFCLQHHCRWNSWLQRPLTRTHIFPGRSGIYQKI